jgi:hypothetical protein
MMDIGFDTIGNATVICYDRGPVLATDPWVQGSAYFGSWTNSHVIPEEQMTAIMASQFIWFSHGHPDHLNPESVGLFRNHQILLPDHYGERIAMELKNNGFKVSILPDKQWVTLSPRIKVLCITDYNQDAVLLIDINGRLLVNLNDASDHGWSSYVKRIIKQYRKSFLLALCNYGCANMINIFNEQGVRIPPAGAKTVPLGASMALASKTFGTSFVLPFSSLHKYQRTDSVWVNQYTPSLADYAIGFQSDTSELLPAYIRYRCDDDSYAEISPAETASDQFDPQYFGDTWSDQLEQSEVSKVTRYFRSISHLERCLDFINVRVGGKDNIIEFKKRSFNRGITFEAPRHSFLTAIQYKVFDDLLIGNFMKTTLHGKWPATGLHPDFTPYVAKYADNGGAKSKQELDEYFSEYRRRTGNINYVRHLIIARSEHIFRSYVPRDSGLFQITRKMYWNFKGAAGLLALPPQDSQMHRSKHENH